MSIRHDIEPENYNLDTSFQDPLTSRRARKKLQIDMTQVEVEVLNERLDQRNYQLSQLKKRQKRFQAQRNRFASIWNRGEQSSAIRPRFLVLAGLAAALPIYYYFTRPDGGNITKFSFSSLWPSSQPQNQGPSEKPRG